jgi:hypothetical protein
MTATRQTPEARPPCRPAARIHSSWLNNAFVDRLFLAKIATKLVKNPKMAPIMLKTSKMLAF